ncbi:MAG: hypothetical protein KKA81_03885 [Bacteroidetes bacterium]|nr:hypothetical protein [Bacteroidota bacterium]
MKKLEDIIRNKRPYLDVEEPDHAYIWEGIERKMEPNPKKRRHFLKIAAIALIILSAGAAIFIPSLRNQNENTFITLSDISPELKTEEMFFTQTIYHQMEEINNANIDHEQYKTFFEEIEILDNYYQEYLGDLQQMGDNPRLIKAMLHYYEMKIRILEKMLNEIEKQQYYENNRKI